MIRYYLDGSEINAPSGIDGITFKKSRHRQYFGFLYRNLGVVEGLGNLTFTDQRAVELLIHRARTEGVMAQTRFEMRDDALGVLYDGWIDYGQYNLNADGFSAGLHDSAAVSSLEALAATAYTIEPDTVLHLPGRRLGGTVSLVLNAERATVQLARKDAATVSHLVPLERAADKTESLPGELPEGSEPFGDGVNVYRNSSGQAQTLSLTGQIRATARANVNTLFTVRLLGGPAPVLIGQYAVNTTDGLVLIVVDVRNVTVPDGGALRIIVEPVHDLTQYSFTYDGISSISVQLSESVQPSTAAAMRADSLFTRLIQKSTPGLNVQSAFFWANDVLLTSGSNLRAVRRGLFTSLSELFTALNAIYNLYLTLDQWGTVIIETKWHLYARRRTTQIRELLSLNERACAERLYHEVWTGYETWQGDSINSALEVNGQRHYTTGVTTVRNTLDLRSKLIASATLIEEQRRKQFDSAAGSSTKADNLDDRLFIVNALTYGPNWITERLEHVRFQSGLTDAGNALNLGVTPRRNLERWSGHLSGCLPLTAESSTTRQAVQTEYLNQTLDETAGLSGPAIPPIELLAETQISLPDYHDLGDWIALPDGREGLLMDAEWRQTAAGDTATLLIWPDWKP